MLICAACVLVVTALLVSLLCVILSDKMEESDDHLPPTTLPTIYQQGVNYKPNINEGNEIDNVCFSPGCIDSAAKVLNQMDPKVEPCDDFYSYACGKFLKETDIPNEKTHVNTFSTVADKVLGQLHKLMTEDMQQNEAAPFKVANNFFKLCMNQEQIEENGIQNLLAILDSLGGWPVLKGDHWDDSSWSWEKSTHDLRRHGYYRNKFFGLYVARDEKNSTHRRITMDEASLGISREYLIQGFDSPIISAYYNYTVDMAVLLGADENRAKVEMLDSLNFEMALAKIELPREELRDSTALYNAMTVKEIQQRYPYTNWVDYFNKIFEDTEVIIDENEVIIVRVPSFMEQLGPLLQNTPKRTMANYAMWSFTDFSTPYLTLNVRKRQLQLTRVLSGKQEDIPRWKKCVQSVTSTFPISVGALYVRKYFREEYKHAVLDMVNNIKDVFLNILKKVDWMDDVTRKAALDKVDAMVTHIGYPNELMNDSKITDYYKGLEINSEDNYLNAILHLNKFETFKTLRNLREPINKTNWITHSKATDVNAYYAPNENSIQFPAAVLQDQLFSYDRPKYMNYGAIGYIIGHEITHGFDDTGRQYDKNGNLLDWWQPDTVKSYLEKTQCIIEQYGNYTEPNVQLNLNGINTQGENIADNGGMKEAYYAYKAWVEKNGPEPRLPGVDLTPEQMFWISAAQTWCSVTRPQEMKRSITTDEHSPARFRIVGPMSNMKEFSKDFKCSTGTPMNPVNKCEVW